MNAINQVSLQLPLHTKRSLACMCDDLLYNLYKLYKLYKLYDHSCKLSEESLVTSKWDVNISA